jgi:SMC interacting uncharacterized protein involved in chromosome segregation
MFRKQNIEMKNEMKNIQKLSLLTKTEMGEAHQISDTMHHFKVDRQLEKLKSNISHMIGQVINQGIPFIYTKWKNMACDSNEGIGNWTELWR